MHPAQFSFIIIAFLLNCTSIPSLWYTLISITTFVSLFCNYLVRARPGVRVWKSPIHNNFFFYKKFSSICLLSFLSTSIPHTTISPEFGHLCLSYCYDICLLVKVHSPFLSAFFFTLHSSRSSSCFHLLSLDVNLFLLTSLFGHLYCRDGPMYHLGSFGTDIYHLLDRNPLFLSFAPRRTRPRSYITNLKLLYFGCGHI